MPRAQIRSWLPAAVLTCLAGLLALARPAAAEPMTYDNALDIGAMMQQAQKTWDLSAQDGILLLEQVHYTWLDDGRLREQRHRVVWIATDVAQRNFADLRIPWDSDRQTFTVQALRVWRGGRWIDARKTAVVETTPFALREAPDYAGIRETMLLHDGVELPCILECAYTIEDKAPYRAGMEGEWTFRHVVPALNSWVILEAPEKAGLKTSASEGVAAPERVAPGATSEGGRSVYWYRMGKMAPAPLPPADRAAADLPRVQWSTYSEWADLGRSLRTVFDDLAGIRALGQQGAHVGPGAESRPGALRDSLAVLLDGDPPAAEAARRITDFVKRSERRVAYDWRLLLPRARSAARTYDTAYGSDLELAALAAGLLDSAGFDVTPAFVAAAPGEETGATPTFALFQSPGLWLQREGYSAYWDASGSKLQTGASLAGRVVWRLPVQFSAGRGVPPSADRSIVTLSLHYDATGKKWTAGGTLEGDGAFSPYDAIAGEADGVFDRLNHLVGGVLTGLAIDSYTPITFTPESVVVTFVTKPLAADPDTLGRIPLVIGAPAGGIISRLPHDVQLYTAERDAPVRLPGPQEQSIGVKIALGGLEVARVPADVRIANDAGSFEVTSARKGDTLTVARKLRLAKSRYAAAEWPALRALLLAEADEANRTVLLQ